MGRKDPQGSGVPGRLTLKKTTKLRERVLADQFGYSNESNPFGDATLAEPFIWKKKNEILKAAGHLRAPSAQTFLEQTQSKVAEIQSVKKRREEREIEEKLLEEQRALLARDKEQENYEEWAHKEVCFHLQMAHERTQIRLDQGRGKSADLYVKALKIVEGEEFDDLTLMDRPPHEAVLQMTVQELESLKAEIETHLETSAMGPLPALRLADSSRLSRPDPGTFDEKYSAFWKALLVLTLDAIEKLKGVDIKAKSSRDSESGISNLIVEEIHKWLGSQSVRQLEELEQQVAKKLRQQEEVDVAYWESIQSKLPFFKARAECLSVHELAKSIARRIRASRLRDADNSAHQIVENEPSPSSSSLPQQGEEATPPQEEEEVERTKCYSPVLSPYADEDEMEVQPEADTVPEDESDICPEIGCWSPRIHSLRPFYNCLSDIVDPVEDKRRRDAHKLALIEGEKQRWRERLAGSAVTKTDEKDWGVFEKFVRDEQKKGLPDEETMGNAQEFVLQRQNYDWAEKYRPRKPRFFNRVKTGYEWNKYNQTHYDHDNPPPKAVQGYKFNIFYPDLIDKTTAPTWTLEPSDTEETVVLRFQAGPPYEDCAFKIINREWELNQRRGYRNCYDRGILQLYFNFKRYRYRR